MAYEPSTSEVLLTQFLARTLMAPYYRGVVRSLHLQGDERVLDYGSGSGTIARDFARILARGDGHLTCVDISRRWMEVAKRAVRRFSNVDCQRGHIAEVDVEDEAYDLVFSHFVIHDISARERPDVVYHLVQKLRSGGRVVLREPTVPGHGMQPGEIRALFTGAGLEEVRLEERRVLLSQDVCDAEFRKA
jgi:SAM-dependent methyltransferase